MNTVLMWLIAVSAILGGLDKIFGNRFGLGKRFDDGFALIGPLVSGMMGIICLTPVISGILRAAFAPLFEKIAIDPAVLGGILPIDMGGFQLASDMAGDMLAGLYAGTIIASTFGCTLCFTIPVGYGMMKNENRTGFIQGILYGLVVLPVTLILGGLFCGFGVGKTLWQCLPVLLLSLLLALGIWKKEKLIARIFMAFAKIIQAVSVIGIIAGMTEYLTGFSLLPGILPMPEALLNAALCGILLVGCMPFAEILNRLFRRPLHALGSRLGMQDRGITGLLLSLVSVTAVLGVMHNMDRDDVMFNAAFLVSAACVFGPHLSVCMINAPEMSNALILSKVVGGVFTLAFVILMREKTSKTVQEL